METVAILDNGGRGHAIGMEVARSGEVEEVVFVPGNAGTDTMEKGRNLIDPFTREPIGMYKLGAVAHALAGKEGYAVIGPEEPLTKAAADFLRKMEVKVVGCGMQGSQLEASKAMAELFMREHGIPRPSARITGSYEDALDAIGNRDPSLIVIKADGLAGGKGVVLPESRAELEDALMKMFSGEGFDGAGRERVLIQERYHGPEVSAFMIRTNSGYRLLPVFSQDHKRLEDGDKGPNTGGMGAYAPLPETILNSRQKEKIEDIAYLTDKGLTASGIDFEGIIYLGVMLAEEMDDNPVLLEYNVRFGDPEAQVILPLLNSADPETVHNILRAVANDDLDNLILPTSIGGAALSVCLVAGGYSRSQRLQLGEEIYGLNATYTDTIIHHGSTRRDEQVIVRTAGGRVIYLTGLGENIDQAAARAYGAIGEVGEDGVVMGGVGFKNMHYRHDIAHQARKTK